VRAENSAADSRSHALARLARICSMRLRSASWFVGTSLAARVVTLLFTRKGSQMFGPAAAYVVAFSAMLFSGLSAVTLIYTVKHLDRPELPKTPAHGQENVAA
jgi:hypothetical protein